jgi:hypothetical protein
MKVEFTTSGGTGETLSQYCTFPANNAKVGMRNANNKVHPEITIQLFRLAGKLFFLFPQKKD